MRDYLHRINAEPVDTPNAAGLARLQRRHLATVPFENLAVHLPGALSLDPADLVEKVVHRRRGGFCFELNGLFGLLLRALGYRVDLVGARVFHGSTPGPPQDHLALVVTDVDGGRWLADVGFGRFALGPLRWDSRAEQMDGVGVFRLTDTPDGQVDVHHGTEGAYRVDPRPLALADFAPMCWWHSTSPASGFTRRLTCSLPLGEAGDRVTLAGRRLIRTVGDQREEIELATDEEVLAAYRTEFGIELNEVPSVATSG